MTNAIFRVPDPTNENVKNYIPNSEEAKKLILAYRKMYAEKLMYFSMSAMRKSERV